jgi:hypothetical protein
VLPSSGSGINSGDPFGSGFRTESVRLSAPAWRLFDEQRRYAVDETRGINYRIIGFRQGYEGTMPHTIISDLLVFVRLGQKYREGSVDFSCPPSQSRKFGANS